MLNDLPNRTTKILNDYKAIFTTKILKGNFSLLLSWLKSKKFVDSINEVKVGILGDEWEPQPAFAV